MRVLSRIWQSCVVSADRASRNEVHENPDFSAKNKAPVGQRPFGRRSSHPSQLIGLPVFSTGEQQGPPTAPMLDVTALCRELEAMRAALVAHAIGVADNPVQYKLRGREAGASADARDLESQVEEAVRWLAPN